MSHRPRNVRLAFFLAAGLSAVVSARRSPAIAAEMSPLGRRPAIVGAPDCRANKRRRRRAHPSGGYRDQAQSRLENLLAVSGRFRRAARVRFLEIGKCQNRDGAVPGADPVPRRRRRALDRLQGRLVLPVHVVPGDSTKPVMLRLKLDYAVCEKLCVPAEANLELTLTGAEKAGDATVGAAEALVPKSTAIGGDGAFAIRAVRREDGSKPKVVVDVAAPAGSTLVLFAEGPTAQWALPLPEPVAGAPAGQQRFAFVARRPAARREPQGRELAADGGRRRQGHRGPDTVSTNSPEALTWRRINQFHNPARGCESWPSRLATRCRATVHGDDGARARSR